jgi:hypothetical protein
MDIAAQACELGLVTRGEVERGLVESLPDSRPGRRAVTLRGRVVAIVREPQRGGLGGGDRSLLGVLGDHDLGPRVLASSDGRLWTEAVPGRSLAELCGSADHSSLIDLTDVCVALGAALAAVHRLPAGQLSVPATRRPSDAHGARAGRESVLGAEIRHAVSADPDLQLAVEAVGRRWSDRYWTLGRIDPDDVVVDSRSGQTVRFADVEAAGLGSADWDVAACLAAVAVAAGRGVPADPHDASVEWLSGHFWNSYRRAGGPGQVHPQVQAMYAIDAAWRAAEQSDTSRWSGSVAPRRHDQVRAWLLRAHRLVSRSATALAA